MKTLNAHNDLANRPILSPLSRRAKLSTPIYISMRWIDLPLKGAPRWSINEIPDFAAFLKPADGNSITRANR